VHFLWWPLENLHQYYWTRTDETTGGEGRLHAYRGSFISSAERIYDPPQYEVTTKDRLLIVINIAIFYRIGDVSKAFFNVMDLYRSMEQVLSTAIVEKASSMTLEEAIEGKDEFQKHVFEIFSEKTEDWGVSITRVDLQSVTPPRCIIDATLETASEERRLGAELRRRKAMHESEILNIEKEVEKQAKEHEKDRAQASHEADMVRIEADSKMYQKMKEAESELAQWKAGADGKKAEVEGLKEAGLSDEALTEYVKWKALEKMPNVQFIPTEALGLMKATQLYHRLEGGERPRE
jgi:regulator of protease activity HflC (stomatin/prohibitin superfamily)